MNNRSVVQSFGWNLGILSGLFAALQVLISASAARANIASIESMRWSIDRLQTGGGNPVPLIGSLVPVVLVAYGSMIITGAISLGLCWYAGRVTAYAEGRRDGGAGAGFRVALLSGIIWIVFSTIISLLLHADGTITGVFTSTRNGSSLLAQLSGLLIQEILLAAIGLGLGAWAGYLGAASAPLDTNAPTAVPMPPPAAFYGMYPPYPAYPPVAGYPSYGGYPLPTPPGHPAPYGPPPPGSNGLPAYPPPPNYYQGPDAATTPTSSAQEPQQTNSAPSPEEPSSHTSTEHDP